MLKTPKNIEQKPNIQKPNRSPEIIEGMSEITPIMGHMPVLLTQNWGEASTANLLH